MPDKLDKRLLMETLRTELVSNYGRARTAVDMWLGDSRIAHADTGAVVIAAPKMAHDALTAEYEHDLRDIIHKCISPSTQLIIVEEAEPPENPFLPGVRTGTEDIIPPAEIARFNSEYTFENYIVGNSNRFIHAACTNVANNPGKVYNPLFIYGPSGLGKTHLLYAMTNVLLARRPRPLVVLAKGEDFTNELIMCIQNKTTEAFRDKYRRADVLLVDDVQFIAGKVSTQEEFFHTFNALFEVGHQIVMTSDRPPNEMKTLEDRLRTRFESGLIADVHAPDYELRLAILRSKAEAVNLRLSDEVYAFLATKLKENIRQLEGAIKKLKALTFLSGAEITMDTVSSAVPEFIRPEMSDSERAKRCIQLASMFFSVTEDDICGKSRTAGIKNARNVAVYLIRQTTSMSLKQIGEMFGRDHTTILNSIEFVDKEMAADRDFADRVGELLLEAKA
jgi:chromosomal replication initiator protein